MAESVFCRLSSWGTAVFMGNGFLLGGVLGKVSMGLPALMLCLTWTSCNRDNVPPSSQYPREIEKILNRTCATKGCHTAESKDAASGLNLETWESLFEGSRGGSPVVPYSPEQSFLLYSINVDSSLGPVLAPSMPLGKDPLAAIDYQLIKRWILEGAKNAELDVRFPPLATRRKWYVGHFGCDLVAVLDAESRQVMRYIKVGINAFSDDALYTVTVSPSGDYWYAAFAIYNSTLDKYSTLTDEKVGSIDLGREGWNTLTISPDGKLGFLASQYYNQVAVLDLQADLMVGSPISLNEDVFAVTVHPTQPKVILPAYGSSHLIVMDYSTGGVLSNRRNVDLVQGVPGSVSGELIPMQVAYLPDGSRYFVTCWNSKEVRVFDGATDSLLSVIVLPAGPANMAISTANGYLFVSCPDDVTTFPDPSKRGSIAIIDLNTLQISAMRYPGFQPYAIALDETSGYLIVANRNELQNGPTQHHASACGGRNGYVTLLDLQTLTVIENYKPELSVDPVTVAIKH